jgi:hypothetical protein
MTLTACTEEIQSQEPIPADAALVMSALEAAHSAREERRMARRLPYRTVTQLRLFRDEPGSTPWELYTRDINRRGFGFLTRHRLPLGYGGVAVLVDRSGRSTPVHCTLCRCREAAAGWFEGSISFNREQPQFES